MSNSIHLDSSIPGMLDDETIQNIIKAMEFSNSKGLSGNRICHYYCSQTTDCNNKNSLGIHISFTEARKDQDEHN